MLGDIRYQWWRDVLDEIYAGGAVRKHEVTTPLADLFREIEMPRFWADQLIDGRAKDLDPQPFADLDAARDYCRQTSGTLMQMAVFILGDFTGRIGRDIAHCRARMWPIVRDVLHWERINTKLEELTHTDQDGA